MSRKQHKAWLKVTAVVVAIGGPIFSLGAVPGMTEPARLTLDILSWPLDGATTYASADTRFLSALTGGFLLGWGVMIWRLVDLAYDAAPEAVRRAVVSGLVAWFLADSAGSIASGAASNALFNVAVLLIAVGPLWRPARDPA
ncbi:MAG: hypothetical protein JNK30_17935 [Phenylobacterium sp.]|uniref:hypothetical protein n=1 Tax=Phenylobacterium sp. TaxID=1871053 RepID=UPI001A5B9C7D|nr:hypothetical protein [Phenylobacterium sp.]MBL8773268.1 hypothetical protein [Phenylobacterium sp.]